MLQTKVLRGELKDHRLLQHNFCIPTQLMALADRLRKRFGDGSWLIIEFTETRMTGKGIPGLKVSCFGDRNEVGKK